ncbi:MULTISPECIES: S-adenosylmethionine:tRNA ribosyltransferase-isomerase [unclassified Spirosoma]|uniref:S-adenosylmethionine:tRNA ribosyltransferase-isomerase n=1 Tax=unclassified Spirosoma TaxID=2621999 RepID=UPI000967A2F2|nr:MULTISPECIES: S-adenosylmethionine:tRNA ribosyltransferase-isomerase [unclassified Spirosoma]MBN8826158.1 S-adenosylmethionine:tRNA ribosyltransferase-isomerase [Spirosoma sp.]OJW76943.1 MAG: S-adenosylmethionine tRNA ribosyltransferase [Spirosoma sp. 48-14]
MTESNELLLSQFQYDLPDERIARFPLAQRDASKLLVYRRGEIDHEQFSSLPALLPKESFLVFNNTKVIPARLYFTKPTGSVIELFLLNPFPNDLPISLSMEATESAIWQGMIGNRKRWKRDETLLVQLAGNAEHNGIDISVSWYDYDQSLVKLSWQPAELTFAQIIHYAGEIPLPPYLKRDPTEADRETYQTVYSKQEGAVAAPTAGLHFTPTVFDNLSKQGIGHDYLTLHVGAGTFQPIKTDDVRQHHMHTEQVVYTQQNLQNLLQHAGKIIPVGTTSMRALESLYWMGAKLINGENEPFRLDQKYAYQLPTTDQPTVKASLMTVLQHMIETQQETLVAHTGIYITPGYELKLCKGIITNFHQPGSTLILLIAALIGDDWKRVYNEALQNDYRFLSYGDSSLLLP